MDKTITLSSKDYKDLKSFCELNQLDEDKVVKSSYLQGFRIEKYGLLSSGGTLTEKEVIKYVDRPVEVIKEIEVVKEIIKEVPSPPKEIVVTEYVEKEVIKEVPVEKIIEKVVKVSDDTQINELLSKIQQLENQPPKVIEIIKEVPVEVSVQDNRKLDMISQTLQNLKQELTQKNKKIEELEKIISNFENYKQSAGAAFLRGSNLNDTL